MRDRVKEAEAPPVAAGNWPPPSPPTAAGFDAGAPPGRVDRWILIPVDNPDKSHPRLLSSQITHGECGCRWSSETAGGSGRHVLPPGGKIKVRATARAGILGHRQPTRRPLAPAGMAAESRPPPAAFPPGFEPEQALQGSAAETLEDHLAALPGCSVQPWGGWAEPSGCSQESTISAQTFPPAPAPAKSFSNDAEGKAGTFVLQAGELSAHRPMASNARAGREQLPEL